MQVSDESCFLKTSEEGSQVNRAHRWIEMTQGTFERSAVHSSYSGQDFIAVRLEGELATGGLVGQSAAPVTDQLRMRRERLACDPNIVESRSVGRTLLGFALDEFSRREIPLLGLDLAKLRPSITELDQCIELRSM